ncbi:PDZ domain-containing protein, partial [bacterium]|nr:PDZ domain-containing protein [bacterium]
MRKLMICGLAFLCVGLWVPETEAKVAYNPRFSDSDCRYWLMKFCEAVHAISENYVEKISKEEIARRVLLRAARDSGIKRFFLATSAPFAGASPECGGWATKLCAAFNERELKKVSLSDRRHMVDILIALIAKDLDKNSRYEDESAIRVEKNGYYGVGMKLDLISRPHGKKGLLVKELFSGYAAERSGIKRLDIITHVNGRPISGITIKDASAPIRGTRKDSAVRLTVLHPCTGKTNIYELRRDSVKERAVQSRMIGTGYVYVRVGHFSGNAGESVERALR